MNKWILTDFKNDFFLFFRSVTVKVWCFLALQIRNLSQNLMVGIFVKNLSKLQCVQYGFRDILKSFYGFVFGARHFSHHSYDGKMRTIWCLEWLFFFKNDGEKCLAPKMNPQKLLIMSHNYIGYPVYYLF